MKKTLITALFAIFVLANFFCYADDHNKPKEVKAWSGRTNVTLQGSYTPAFDIDGSDAEIHNVILMIGDGMGLGAVNSAMYANGGELTMTNLKTMGYVRTQSASDFTTDSAASGSAYACGIKTTNGYLGENPAQEKVANLPEKLSPLGYVSGVVSTDDLNGATPAAFFAHQSARGATAEIWADLPTSSLIFASAGSQKVFEGLELKTQDAIKSQFSLVYSPSESEKIASSKRLVYLPESVKYDERGAYLPETTKMAIEYLSSRSDKGFFLMVEGARIDKESHSNNFVGTVRETLDFDKAIEEAIRFAEADGHTLVIISADHETGALSLLQANPAEGFATGTYVSRGHSPMMVPLFAYGPQSKAFVGLQENSDVSNKIFSIMSSSAPKASAKRGERKPEKKSKRK